MAYDDKYYFGMTKVVVRGSGASATARIGDSVVASTALNQGLGAMLVPCGNKYTISTRDGSKDILAGYGDCVSVSF